MIPDYYEFHNPVKILSGFKALENLPYELELLGSSRPMIITDKGIEKAGLVKTVINACGDSDVVFPIIFDEVPQDSSTKIVSKAAELYRENNCDALIAIGGGSVIDTAKGTNVLVSYDSNDLSKFMGADIIKKPLNPFVVIPTTAGTGSEVTIAAVIKDEEKGIKMPFTSRYLLPNVAILDPRMTMTLPPKISAATAMDALTHAIESYICLQKNPLSDAYAISAIKIISSYILQVIKEKPSKEARLAMANAATMAGIAFSNSMVGMVHSLGHALGAVAHIPHGIAMSIFLPWGLKTNLEARKNLIGELLLPFSGAEKYSNTPQEQRAIELIREIRKLQDILFEKVKIPRTLKEANVSEELLPEIAQKAIDDGSLIYNPIDLTYEDALTILKKAYDETVTL